MAKDEAPVSLDTKGKGCEQQADHFWVELPIGTQ